MAVEEEQDTTRHAQDPSGGFGLPDFELAERVLFPIESGFSPFLLPTLRSLDFEGLTDSEVQAYCTPVAVSRFINAVLHEEKEIRSTHQSEEDSVRMDTDLSRDQHINTPEGTLYIYVSKPENPVTKFHMSYHEDKSMRTVIFNASRKNPKSALIEATYFNATRQSAPDPVTSSGAMISYPVTDSPANARAFLEGQIWVAQVLGAMREVPKFPGMTVPLPKLK